MAAKNYFEVKVLKNLTTDINMLRKQEDAVIEAIEYDAEHIVFETDEKASGQGQLVNLEGIIHLRGSTYPFQAQGKVSEIVKLGNGRMKVIIELRSFDKRYWAMFVGYMLEQQEALDRTFRAMRDEE